MKTENAMPMLINLGAATMMKDSSAYIEKGKAFRIFLRSLGEAKGRFNLALKNACFSNYH